LFCPQIEGRWTRGRSQDRVEASFNVFVNKSRMAAHLSGSAFFSVVVVNQVGGLLCGNENQKPPQTVSVLEGRKATLPRAQTQTEKGALDNIVLVRDSSAVVAELSSGQTGEPGTIALPELPDGCLITRPEPIQHL